MVKLAPQTLIEARRAFFPDFLDPDISEPKNPLKSPFLGQIRQNPDTLHIAFDKIKKVAYIGSTDLTIRTRISYVVLESLLPRAGIRKSVPDLFGGFL